jgi:F-type H+-transporting ATPase subunit b
MKKMIDSRQKEIDDMYQNAEEAETTAEAMKVSYEEKLSKANEESEEILKTALRRAQLKEEEIIRDAQTEASRIYERAEEQIALEKKRALSEVKDEVSGMAVEIAGAIMSNVIGLNR